MPVQPTSPKVVQFGVFELDLQRSELRKQGVRVKLQDQPLKVLQLLLESPGQMLSREQLRSRIWPADTFVEFDKGLYSAMARLRDALGDNSASPYFIETVARHGYRFIAPVTVSMAPQSDPQPLRDEHEPPARRTAALRQPVANIIAGLLLGALLVVIILEFDIVGAREWLRRQFPTSGTQRSLTRLTFDPGLQIGATWSPDSRFLAYSSNRLGKFDIWVQQLSGGDPIQVTHDSAQNWQPDWSPDGESIAFRSEGNRGVYVIPAFGGAGEERRVSSFGYYPRWSPDGSRILLQTSNLPDSNRFYLASLDGNPPKEILSDFLSRQRITARSAIWHPDGKRISIWTWGDQTISPSENPGTAPVFWTISLATGDAIKTEISSGIAAQIENAAPGLLPEGEQDSRFFWAPAGDAIYFERTLLGAKNLWKLSVNPKTLRATAIERLTTGTELHTDFSLSPDGDKVAFTGESRERGVWLFPFDANHGKLVGPGKRLTSPGMTVLMHGISRDGSKLAFNAIRAGRPELWELSFADLRESAIYAGDDFMRAFPVWSPDGHRLAYLRLKSWKGPFQLFEWSFETSSEEPLSPLTPMYMHPFEWSTNGSEIFLTQLPSGAQFKEIWRRSAVLDSALASAERVVSFPDCNLFQAHISPDGKWMVFEAYRETPTRPESKIYVSPLSGGLPVQISQTNFFEDKPRWSPDGKTIYFVSDRDGFFNVWSVHFDPASGKASGAPLRVTQFDSPALSVPKVIGLVELSLASDKFILNLDESSGGIWMLSGVNK